MLKFLVTVLIFLLAKPVLSAGLGFNPFERSSPTSPSGAVKPSPAAPAPSSSPAPKSSPTPSTPAKQDHAQPSKSEMTQNKK